ncbi:MULTISPECIES: hypothetical protein [Burkholderia]|uniref:hypothetical protein n=1 Tax=Burkholderia TaxID=32008 RepID=UPI000B02D326|nr:MULTISPECIES: hypothetical protein [Burkholderia]MCA8432283.1 hypothetical protein [Burkholderia seminalis]
MAECRLTARDRLFGKRRQSIRVGPLYRRRDAPYIASHAGRRGNAASAPTIECLLTEE